MSAVSHEVTNHAPHFRSCRADGPGRGGLRDEAFRLRYQIHCLERRDLPERLFPDGLEIDLHDARAAHFCAFDRSGSMVGYGRLVPADAQSRLPFHDHGVLFDDAALPTGSRGAELGRLIVRGDYRRRLDDTLAGVGGAVSPCPPAADRRGGTPQLLLSLLRPMLAFSRERNIVWWLAEIEVPLARALAQLHASVRPVGPQIEHLGIVVPCLVDLAEWDRRLAERAPALREWLQDAPGGS